MKRSGSTTPWLQLDIGAMPICGDDERLKGMLTDRDIVVKVIAQGKSRETTHVGELAGGKPVTIAPTIRSTKPYESCRGIGRRLPVIDGHKLVGLLSQAVLAKALPSDRAGELIKATSSGG